MKRPIFLILIILFKLMVITCAPSINDYGGTIISIEFSEEWNSGTGQIGTPVTSFDYGIKIVYYEITFDEQSHEGVVVQKVWDLPVDPDLEATTFVPKYSKRICGELHYYDTTTDMRAGDYQISVKYYEDGLYEEYLYDTGVNRTFTIQ